MRIHILEWNFRLFRENNAKTLVFSAHSNIMLQALDLVCDSTTKDDIYSLLDEQKPRSFWKKFSKLVLVSELTDASGIKQMCTQTVGLHPYSQTMQFKLQFDEKEMEQNDQFKRSRDSKIEFEFFQGFPVTKTPKTQHRLTSYMHYKKKTQKVN
jgi:hypothetical protein